MKFFKKGSAILIAVFGHGNYVGVDVTSIYGMKTQWRFLCKTCFNIGAAERVFIFCNRFRELYVPESINRNLLRVVGNHNAMEEVRAAKEKREAVILSFPFCPIIDKIIIWYQLYVSNGVRLVFCQQTAFVAVRQTIKMSFF